MAGATLRDVARRAGVSIRTVSNVVNASVPVSDELRTRVEAALEELDYRPNLVARNLRRGRTGMLAFIVPELDVPYFAELAREVITAARAHGYVVMLDQTDGDRERERELLSRESRATMFDGLLLSPLSISEDELRGRTNRVPVVLLGEHIFNGHFHHVAIDNVAAAREATEHLIALGRRRIAAIGDQPYSTGETAQLRTIGYRQALTAAGLPLDESLVVPTPRFHRHLGAEAMNHLLALPEPPDAVFCYNDLLAIGAMHALTRAGSPRSRRHRRGRCRRHPGGRVQLADTHHHRARQGPHRAHGRQHARRDHRRHGIATGRLEGAVPVGGEGQHHERLSSRVTARTEAAGRPGCAGGAVQGLRATPP